MSAKEHDEHDDHGHDSDMNEHERAAAATPVPALPPTPEHGFWRSMNELAGEADFHKDPAVRAKCEGGDLPLGDEVRVVLAVADPVARRVVFRRV